MRSFVTVLLKAAIVNLLWSQAAESVLAQQVRSPEVHANGTVTFRHRASNTENVEARIARVQDGVVEMEKTQDGWWIGTSKILPAGIHEYSFRVDGDRQIDPLNRWVKKWYSLDSLFEIPGNPARLSEMTAVPHGTLHHHVYRSSVTDADRRLIVYTPPQYSAESNRTFPTLYLLHGFGDDQTAWTEVGRAHWIADNLIDAGKMEPMFIVMPYGHPVELPYGNRSPDYGEKNDLAMRQDIIQEVLPFIEANYPVEKAPTRRAIIGLSMGGGHALRIGLSHSNQFAWVGAMSAAAPSVKSMDRDFPNFDQWNDQLDLLWIACGKDDFLLQRNQDFVASLREHQVRHTYLETEGSHNWSVWRDDYLPKFLQAVFK